MATPEIHLKSADMSMELTQAAPLVRSVAFSPDMQFALSGSTNDTATLWDLTAATAVRTFSAPRGYMGDGLIVAFSKDGLYGMTGGKGLKIWDLSTGGEVRTIGNRRTMSIAVSPDKQSVLTGEWPSGVVSITHPYMSLWDMNTGRQIRGYEDSERSAVGTVAFSPDGRYALSGHRGGKMFLWDVASGNMINSVKADRDFLAPDINSVAFSPNGKYALSGGMDNTLRLWNIPSLILVKEFHGHTGTIGISSVAFSPDGKYALSGGWYDGFIKLWNLSTGAEIRSIKAHSSMIAVSSLAISPDGKFILSGGDASTRIWDFSTGEEVCTMISFKDGEWVVITANGYYNSSEKGDQYLSVTVGGKPYTISQLRESFYRPDIVKLALSGGSLKSYAKLSDIK